MKPKRVNMPSTMGRNGGGGHKKDADVIDNNNNKEHTEVSRIRWPHMS